MTWVDVHHHAYHGALADALAHRGVTHMAPGVPVPRWRVEDSLRVMENCGLDAALLSVLMPDKALVLPDAAELVRATNEWTAEVVAAHPDRFGLLATLPLPDLDASLVEVGHVFDALQADGVVLPASLADGALLGDPAQEPLFAELDRRAAVVLVHPNPGYRCSCTGAEDFPAVVPPPLVDFVMDTTRAVSNLLFRGVLRRYPRIRFVLAHGGGTIPFLAGRLELAQTWVLPDRDGSVRDELAGLYYETAQAFSAAALSCVDSVAPPDHVLFGTDFPFMGEPVVAATRRDVAAHRVAVGAAALDLFPRLRRG
ncbi:MULTISPECIES: amidohydrolase family protein [unclassified Saccharothrix]|uniref:amidohydrolase family protein n=1 Tax=unclassified Saccharothrix TaxID=2593673 RepID=UPI00307D5CD8